MRRIHPLLTALRDCWADDPAGRGAAKVLAGGALILVGAVTGFGGVSGVLVGALLGGALLLAGRYLQPPEYPDQRTTQGWVAEVIELAQEAGPLRYRPVYAFEAAGRDHQVPARIRARRPPPLGEPVRIAYSAANPGNAHRADGLEGNLHRVAYAVGGGALLISLLSLAVSLAMVIGGFLLWRSGSAERMATPQAQGLLHDLQAMLRRARQAAVGAEPPPGPRPPQRRR
ncbi:hypothetical protein [Halorhodospira neutriphila]|uniref:DUF3592 domain-containing protein n=1 Tax=Halorhodospira neutriphila TaxID=168379 RepID=A0ABS1E7I3_9GAMM|nr:hypothetical protein [Halorhodospira neutriphila]MBK1726700.1 hypothetical protein [Halorhodospira neutriphila]